MDVVPPTTRGASTTPQTFRMPTSSMPTTHSLGKHY